MDSTEYNISVLKVIAKRDAWSVCVVKDTKGNQFKMAGVIPGLEAGDSYLVRGAFVEDKYGRSFKVFSFETSNVNTRESVENWIKSRFPNIGPVRAAKLVAKFGPQGLFDLLETTDGSHQRLTEIPGITADRAEEIKQSYLQYKHERALFSWLFDLGLNQFVVKQVSAHWANDVGRAKAAIEADPYVLLLFRGTNFEAIDSLARTKFAVIWSDPRRLRAAAAQSFKELATQHGHSWCCAKELLDRTQAFLGFQNRDAIASACIDGYFFATSPSIVRCFVVSAPCIVHSDPNHYCTTLTSIDQSEWHVAEGIAKRVLNPLLVEMDTALLPQGTAGVEAVAVTSPTPQTPAIASPPPVVPCDREGAALLARFESYLELDDEPQLDAVVCQDTGLFVLDAEQQRAVDLLTGPARCGVIAGGPGCGKTTITKQALAVLRARKHKPLVQLCAPTGKAARRLAGAAGYPANTVHRLLGWQGAGFNTSAPLESDVIIVDEASMLDLEVAAALVRSLRDRTRLFFVGDANQLPSVGPGSVLADLLASNAVPTIRLGTVHRTALESWVCRNAPEIIAGRLPDMGATDDFEFAEANSVERVIEVLISARAQLLERGGVQVLTPQNKGPLGTSELNLALKSHFNPAHEDDGANIGGLKGAGKVLVHIGDPVINTRNNYELDLMNGEVGTVTDISNREIIVDFDGKGTVGLPKPFWLDLQLAYALTIHKMQGSQCAWPIIVTHSMHSFMLSRQILYTAITRSQTGVVLVGNQEGVVNAIANNRPAIRHTRLAEKLRSL